MVVSQSGMEGSQTGMLDSKAGGGTMDSRFGMTFSKTGKVESTTLVDLPKFGKSLADHPIFLSEAMLEYRSARLEQWPTKQ